MMAEEGIFQQRIRELFNLLFVDGSSREPAHIEEKKTIESSLSARVCVYIHKTVQTSGDFSKIYFYEFLVQIRFSTWSAMVR